jgi:hypothetical protein
LVRLSVVIRIDSALIVVDEAQVAVLLAAPPISIVVIAAAVVIVHKCNLSGFCVIPWPGLAPILREH